MHDALLSRAPRSACLRRRSRRSAFYFDIESGNRQCRGTIALGIVRLETARGNTKRTIRDKSELFDIAAMHFSVNNATLHFRIVAIDGDAVDIVIGYIEIVQYPFAFDRDGQVDRLVRFDNLFVNRRVQSKRTDQIALPRQRLDMHVKRIGSQTFPYRRIVASEYIASTRIEQRYFRGGGSDREITLFFGCENIA